MSPTARIAYPTPSTAPAIAVAVRALSASCAVTAATPANTHPHPANAAPKAIDPGTGAPCAIPATATTSPIIRAAPAAVTTAATSCADLPTTPAISSSVLPASSSARVRPITVKIVISPIMVEASTPIRHAVSPPTVVDPTGPSIARNAGFAVIDAASAVRSTSSGYNAAIAENVDAATALTPTIQISNDTRSRRRFSRISTNRPDQLTTPALHDRYLAGRQRRGHRGHFAPRADLATPCRPRVGGAPASSDVAGLAGTGSP